MTQENKEEIVKKKTRTATRKTRSTRNITKRRDKRYRNSRYFRK